MNICVFGMWHLGCVTSACLAKIGMNVIGVDFDKEIINNLINCVAPISEPGLDDILKEHVGNNLLFTDDINNAVTNSDYIWVTYDTPIDDNDNADVDYVINKIKKIIPHIKKRLGIIISSQLPVGTTRSLIRYFSTISFAERIHFAYSPENLRLGKALEIFFNPDRIVIGTDPDSKQYFSELFSKISNKLEWMSIESSEMTKHAINAFLAASVVFANEIATLCESVGADAREVSRGLKTEKRIGEKAYVSPGNAIAGGTLNRDINFLIQLSTSLKIPTDVLVGIKTSNDKHKKWQRNKIIETLGSLVSKKIGILGLTYKPGTNILRRSLSIELCKDLKSLGADIYGYDPSIKYIEMKDRPFITLSDSIIDVFSNSDCIVVCTEWPEFKEHITAGMIESMKDKIIIDANGFLEKFIQGLPQQINYIRFGRGKHEATQ
jgi:UDPglucose 6-dehydrogenase